MKTHYFTLTKLILFCFVPLVLAGCGGDSLNLRYADQWSDQQFYENAKSSLEDEDYRQAILLYQALSARFPYGRYAEQAQLEIIYAYHKAGDVEAATSAADQFIRTNPTHINIDYAYYLKGLVSFDEERTLIDRLVSGGDNRQQDIKPYRDSYLAFKDMIDRYPDSRYTSDATQRMAYLLNELARYEVSVAEYYLSQEAYVAALNRCRTVVEDYQQTSAVEDALGIMIATYARMGMNDLAEDSRRVLQENFPASDYLEQSNAEIAKRSFFSRLFNRRGDETRVVAADTTASNAEAAEDNQPGFFSRLFGRTSQNDDANVVNNTAQ